MFESIWSWLILAICLISLVKIFQKAGAPSIGAFVPFYNLYIILKIAGKPWWYLLLLFIPIINLVIYIFTIVDFVKQFNKGMSFAVGTVFLPFIFLPLLALAKTEYKGVSYPHILQYGQSE